MTEAINLEKMSYGIEALGRRDGKVVFVPYGAPDEQVKIEIIEDRADYSRARLVEIVTPSPRRRPSPCPNFPACGGCHWLHLAGETQRREKEAYLGFLLRPLRPATVYPIEACAEFRYRNKMDLKVAVDAGGRLRLGNYRIQSHEVIDMTGCVVQVAANMEIYAHLQRFLGDVLPRDDLAAIDRITCRTLGEQRQLVVHWQQPASARALDAWRAFFAATEQVSQLSTCGPGEQLALLRDAAPFEMMGQTWTVSPLSFFQGNLEGAEAIYYTLQSLYAGNDRAGRLLDLYSGVGVQTLLIDRGFEEVIAVESSESSHQDAVRNLRARRRTQVRFVHRRAEAVVGSPLTRGGFAAVHVNPPRVGLSMRVARGLIALKPRMITYLSCHPLTFKRDAAMLVGAGYRLDQVYSFDLFPNTFHLEILGVFRR